MIKVTPILSKDEQRLICERFSLSYNPALLAYKTEINHVIIGVVTFYLCEKKGVIVDIYHKNDDFAAIEMTVRSVMNFLDLHGFTECLIENLPKYAEDVVEKIGYKRNNDGKHFIKVEGFFGKRCCAIGKFDE